MVQLRRLFCSLSKNKIVSNAVVLCQFCDEDSGQKSQAGGPEFLGRGTSLASTLNCRVAADLLAVAVVAPPQQCSGRNSKIECAWSGISPPPPCVEETKPGNLSKPLEIHKTKLINYAASHGITVFEQLKFKPLSQGDPLSC